MSDAQNPYLAYAEGIGRRRRPMQAKVVTNDAAAPMKPTGLEKAERERSQQLQRYRSLRREHLDAARHGKYGADVIALQNFLRRMTIEMGDALIDFVKITKLPRADIETRYAALRMVGDAIERLRIQNGLPPFDDSLPGEPPTVFEIIRAELGVP